MTSEQKSAATAKSGKAMVASFKGASSDADVATNMEANLLASDVTREELCFLLSAAYCAGAQLVKESTK
jgi:hypothetical protein